MYKRENTYRRGYINLLQERMGGGLSSYPRKVDNDYSSDSDNERKQSRQAQFKQQIEAEDQGEDPTLIQKNSNPDQQGGPDQDAGSAENDDQDPEVGNVVFYILLGVAVILDAAAFLINLIPGVGGIIASILIDIPGSGLFLFIFYKLGIKFTSAKRKNKLLWPLAVKAFPIINALPGFTVSVILNLKGKQFTQWFSKILNKSSD